MRLTPVQSSILLALGMQRKTIEDVEVCLNFFIFFFFVVRAKLTIFNRRSSTYLPHKLLPCSSRLSGKSVID